MICPKCNKEIPDGSKFCLECGSDVSSESGVEPERSLGMEPTLVGGAGGNSSDAPELSLGDERTVQGSGAGADDAPSSSETPLSDRYELGDAIGSGGFAQVFLARDKKLGRTVAVKRLRPEHASGKSGQRTIDRFIRESQAIASLNHRNIVQVYDADRDADGHYIVMEHVDGGTLDGYLKENGKLELTDAVRLFTGIAQGLAYAHRHNLVHRDMKPANILLASEGGQLVPKIVDFGLAQAGRDSELSMTGYGMGTPAYMPPEQRRDAKNVNHTADIYALGPPPELSKIIFKSIKTKPEERYFSVDDMLRDIESLSASPSALASPSSTSSATGGNACPSCGAPNPDDVKFCEHCGTGLTRVCPECGREDSVHKKFCGKCGTDIEGFIAVRDAVEKMERYADEHKWSRMIKEYTLLHDSVQMPGPKGQEIWNQSQKLGSLAANKKEEFDGLFKKIELAVAKQEYETCDSLLSEYLRLHPQDQAMKVIQTKLNEFLRFVKDRNHSGIFKKAQSLQDKMATLAPDALCPTAASLVTSIINPMVKDTLQSIEESKERAKKLLQSAEKAAAEEEWSDAFRLLDKALELFPSLNPTNSMTLLFGAIAKASSSDQLDGIKKKNRCY